MLSVARQIDIIDTARQGIRAEWILAESLGTPLTELNERVAAVINLAASHKGLPRYEVGKLHAYNAGIYDIYRFDRFIFLYCVNGQMYGARETVNNLPNWRELPKEEYDALADKGGLYWRKLAEQGIYKIAASTGSATANDKARQIK